MKHIVLLNASYVISSPFLRYSCNIVRTGVFDLSDLFGAIGGESVKSTTTVAPSVAAPAVVSVVLAMADDSAGIGPVFSELSGSA